MPIEWLLIALVVITFTILAIKKIWFNKERNGQ